MTSRLVPAAYLLGWATLRVVPAPVVTASFDAVAWLNWRQQGRSVECLRANLRRVLGPDAPSAELERLTKAGIRSYARYWREVLRFPRPGTIVQQFEVADEARLRTAYAAGHGVILALPHMGNWDQAGAWCALTGMPFTTVVERLEPPSLFDRFVRFRESLGMEVIPLTGAERAPFDLLVTRLRRGGMLCLLADRDLTDSGIDVDLFGSRVRMPAGPAALARRTGAALLPVSLWFTEDGWGARIHPQVPPDTLARMTQQVADAFAEGIAAHPQDWHMLQPLWLDDLAQIPAGTS